ncbi:hypothetical protein G5647_03250 [Pectobacterium carotovorum]|uniref:hypothetical protein n=1 Tax=Pectobacterium carotovorum TaxID=554 RepID=UPI00191D1F23|nr:hypothetical protein [Pectobacterium carotovorum]MBL0865420.1 hypothetical protein [Pectobacterium carotovorum]
MTINEGGFEFNLSPQKPDEVTVDSLKASLTSLGLTCDETTPDKLQKYITDVRSKLPTGNYQAFAIRHYGDDSEHLLATSNGQWAMGK